MNTVVQVVFYGLLAGASALAVASVLVVLRTPRGRVNGLAFGIGFLVAQFLVCLILLLIGTQTVPRQGSERQVFVALIEILAGLGMLVAARRVAHPSVRTREPRPIPPRIRRLGERLDARRRAAFERLSTLHVGAMLSSGALLGVGGLKRLTLAILAMAAVAGGKLSPIVDTALVGAYVGIATLLVWVPVTLALVFGSRVADWAEAAQQWFRAHERTAAVWALAVFGGYLVISGVVGLVQL